MAASSWTVMRLCMAARISWMSLPPTGPRQQPPIISPAAGSGAQAANNLAGGRIGEQFSEAVLGFHDDRLAEIAEGVAGREVRAIRRAGALLGQAHDGKLRLGEDDLGVEAVVHRLHAVGMGQVMRGDFALLDGDVNNLIQAGAIAGSIDMGQAGLHLRIGDDAAALDADSDAFEAERGDVRDPAKCEENLLRAHMLSLAVVREGDFLPVFRAAGIETCCAGVKVAAFAAEDFLQFGSGIDRKSTRLNSS